MSVSPPTDAESRRVSELNRFAEVLAREIEGFDREIKDRKKQLAAANAEINAIKRGWVRRVLDAVEAPHDPA